LTSRNQPCTAFAFPVHEAVFVHAAACRFSQESLMENTTSQHLQVSWDLDQQALEN
jgi:hypothetical protein